MEKPRIAILGAGPVGLDAALAAMDAGLPFVVYEASEHVGAHLRRWGHVRMFTPWSMNLSGRMLRHVGCPEPSDLCPTGAEFAERILEPVGSLQGVAPRLHVGRTVVAVSREGLLKSDEIGTGRRSDSPFRLLLRTAHGDEEVAEADVVLDCTGSYGNPNPLGDGGIPAPGERMAAKRIHYGIPDLTAEPGRWLGRSTLLVGAGHSAQTVAHALSGLASSHPGTRVVWCIRGASPRVESFEDDPLRERAALNAAANALLERASGPVESRTATVVDRVAAPTSETEPLQVTLRSRTTGARETLAVDNVVALTGAVGDHSIYRQLQVHECYATSGPMKLAGALLASSGADCLEQTGHGFDTLVSPEPNFYILGSKSYGRNNTFLLGVGYEQVDDVFEALGPAHVSSDGAAAVR